MTGYIPMARDKSSASTRRKVWSYVIDTLQAFAAVGACFKVRQAVGCTAVAKLTARRGTGGTSE